MILVRYLKTVRKSFVTVRLTRRYYVSVINRESYLCTFTHSVCCTVSYSKNHSYTSV
jgi:hypothetical protein